MAVLKRFVQAVLLLLALSAAHHADAADPFWLVYDPATMRIWQCTNLQQVSDLLAKLEAQGVNATVEFVTPQPLPVPTPTTPPPAAPPAWWGAAPVSPTLFYVVVGAGVVVILTETGMIVYYGTVATSNGQTWSQFWSQVWANYFYYWNPWNWSW